MNINRGDFRRKKLSGPGLAALLLVAMTTIGIAQVSEVVRTNWTQRTHTNVVEVTVPNVLIVNQYRTNTTVRYTTNLIEVHRTQWMEQFATNVFNVVRTNVITKNLTNLVAVDRYTTNIVDRFSTNWLTAFVTNRITRTQTNVVEVARTNTVLAYRTNVTTLNATNWQTVLVMKTNWVTQPLTNVVAVNLPAAQSRPAPPTAAVTPVTKTTASSLYPPVSAPAVEVDDLVIEWGGAVGDQSEVLLTLKSANDSATILPVSEWRVERTDGAVLVMGNRTEFRGKLPPGDYDVKAMFRPSADSSAVKVRGKIKVNSSTQVQTTPAAMVGQ